MLLRRWPKIVQAASIAVVSLSLLLLLLLEIVALLRPGDAPCSVEARVTRERMFARDATSPTLPRPVMI